MNTKQFFEKVEYHFAWLRQRGYVPGERVEEDYLTYAYVALVGKAWTVTLNFDFKENEVVDCYLCRTGEPSSRDRDLVGILIERHGYRGGAGRPLAGEGPTEYQIRNYSELLKKYADLVIPEHAEPRGDT